MIDHLVYACPDLDAGIRHVEDLLGVGVSPGGRHDGLGTRNALIGLGPEAFLEIVSVDPDQPAPAAPRWFGLDTLSEAGLVTWCAKHDRLAELVDVARAVDFDLGSVTTGARRKHDGSSLEWVFTDPRADRLGGVVPFFIDWGASVHPARDLRVGCTVASLAAEHPDPERVRAVLRALDVDLPVEKGPRPSLTALLDTPGGVVRLE